MADPTYRAADYLTALQALLPRGRAWPRDPDAVQTKALSGLTPAYERSDTAARQLLQDTFPATAYAMLPEWEQSLGLPSICTGQLATIQARRNAVVAALTNYGGQSASYFIGQAAKLGYTVTVTNYAPFRVGQNRVGQPVGIVDWAHTWSINATLNTVTAFRTGQSAVGEPLNSWSNQLLECTLSAIKPAHTVLQFHYQ